MDNKLDGYHVSIQRLRNLTTPWIHTSLDDLDADLCWIMGFDIVGAAERARAYNAVLPWLKAHLPDPRLWDGEHDLTHTGVTFLPEPTLEERTLMIAHDEPEKFYKNVPPKSPDKSDKYNGPKPPDIMLGLTSMPVSPKRIDNQRIRNLTTTYLHTSTREASDDLEWILGVKNLRFRDVFRANMAVIPWLRVYVSDPRFWNDEYDTSHGGHTRLPEPTPQERAEMLVWYLGTGDTQTRFRQIMSPPPEDYIPFPKPFDLNDAGARQRVLRDMAVMEDRLSYNPLEHLARINSIGPKGATCDIAVAPPPVLGHPKLTVVVDDGEFSGSTARSSRVQVNRCDFVDFILTVLKLVLFGVVVIDVVNFGVLWGGNWAHGSWGPSVGYELALNRIALEAVAYALIAQARDT